MRRQILPGSQALISKGKKRAAFRPLLLNVYRLMTKSVRQKYLIVQPWRLVMTQGGQPMGRQAEP